MNLKVLLFTAAFFFSFASSAGEVNSWDCNKFDGAKIISGDGEFLGVLGAVWMTDSIFNDSSEYASTWSQTSIYNQNSDYGSSFSNLSARAFIASNLSSEYCTQNSTVWPVGLAFSISAEVIANIFVDKKNVAKNIILKIFMFHL